MEKELKKVEKNGNEIKSFKLYDFVLFGVYEVGEKIELNFVESRKNEWNCENSIVKKFNNGLSGKCLGLIMMIGEGKKVKEELEIGFGRVICVENWKWGEIKVDWFKGFKLATVRGEEGEEKRVVGKLFNSLEGYVKWCKDRGEVLKI